MKVVMINGSQKVGQSNSGIILDRLKYHLSEKHEVETYNSGICLFTEEIFNKIVSGDVIILAFPLFAYSIPSHTLKMLIGLENAIKRKNVNNLIIYTIINCGFFEGKQNNVAFEIIQNWCNHSGVKYGGGIGQGAGEALGGMKDIDFEKSPFRNLEQELKGMVKKIELKDSFEVVYLSPLFPQFLFKFFGTLNWIKKARKNGLKIKDIKKKL